MIKDIFGLIICVTFLIVLYIAYYEGKDEK